jgi:branched-chain amino acid aminotransferase
LGGVTLKRIKEGINVMLVYLNGKYVNEKNATVSINNRSFRYGDGFFETIKVVNGNIPLWNYHTQRLFATLDVLQFERLNYWTPDQIKDTILQLVNKNLHQKLARVRLTFYRGEGGIYDPINHKPNILIQSWELNEANNSLNENGLVIGLYEGGFKAADAVANYKTNNYLLYVLAALQVKQQHWNDALVLNHRGGCCDTTIANLWIIKEGVIYTPPLSDGPVAGTMRKYLLDHLRGAGFEVHEQSLALEDVNAADECFLTNAIYGLRWVKQFGDKTYTSALTERVYLSLVKSLWLKTN